MLRKIDIVNKYMNWWFWNTFVSCQWNIDGWIELSWVWQMIYIYIYWSSSEKSPRQMAPHVGRHCHRCKYNCEKLYFTRWDSNSGRLVYETSALPIELEGIPSSRVSIKRLVRTNTCDNIRDVYLYKKFAVQVGSWYTGGGDDVLLTKNQRGVGLQHTKYIIANGKLRQSSTFW